MSSPPNASGTEAQQLPLAGSQSTYDDGAADEIPRRLMRVKVLYTFDDENKSNCLARLPNALSIPTVALDESTQVGVLTLKACIQAIVAASPELVAKLGHDYTVYAYDYSEYETPLVGQGMLSWILASASATPNAPANESQTMVTGRVCKNILGLFSNGIKETLEVKLKLVPVPTSMQQEYVQNMERYHSLSKMFPEGLDYSAWKDFLDANPAFGHLAQPTTHQHAQWNQSNDMRHVDHAQPHHMHLEDDSMGDAYVGQHHFPFGVQGPRPSSPAMSTASYNHYHVAQDSRPASRASFRSDVAPQMLHHRSFSESVPYQQEPEEGPAKKRARVTKATRPKKTALAANNDSLRVTASTAASVRLHKPIATNPAAALAGIEQVPRAPTPRPRDTRFAAVRPPPSLLRHISTEEGRPYVSPYESGIFSDNAVDSADDERGPSPGETPLDIPSSPPIMPHHFDSPAPSSPGLPTLLDLADSGFVSDLPQGRDEDSTGARFKRWDGSDLPMPADTRIRAKQDRSKRPWTEVTPGPVELLPQSYIAKPKTYPRQRKAADTEKPGPVMEAFIHQSQEEGASTGQVVASIQSDAVSTGLQPTESTTLPEIVDAHLNDRRRSIQLTTESGSQRQLNGFGSSAVGRQDALAAHEHEPSHRESRSETPSLPLKPSKNARSRGLPRSHTWSGEPMSDSPVPDDVKAKNPRSGSGASRKNTILKQMNASIQAGELPTYCNNCGEIETPAWRNAYTRVIDGSPRDVELSTDGKTGIIGLYIIEPSLDGVGGQYQIFKSILGPGDKESEAFKQLVLCNPCGLWLNKKGVMRPSTVWAKNDSLGQQEKPKRKRNPPKNASRKKAKGDDDIISDAVVPHSEPVMPGASEVPALHDGSADAHMQPPPPVRSRTSSIQGASAAAGTQLDDSFAAAALQRAIQSSPGGFRGSKDLPIDLEPRLTPKPIRRLLFPSPRKVGEAKSLADSKDVSPSGKSLASDTAGELVPLPGLDAEGTDKENCPPPANHDDDLAHLFEDKFSPKTTPTKSTSWEDLLKTPTPGSRRSTALTPRRNLNNSGIPTTPSRVFLTPKRNERAATLLPVTPFTAQLNALLSDCLLPSSPSQALGLSALPLFNSPGRSNSNYDYTANFDFGNVDDILSSDFPMPSSPPQGLGFNLYEDPATCTVGLWSGASMLGSDVLNMDEAGDGQLGNDGDTVKMSEISVDFAAMIEQVVAGGPKNMSLIKDGAKTTPKKHGEERSSEKEAQPKDNEVRRQTEHALGTEPRRKDAESELGPATKKEDFQSSMQANKEERSESVVSKDTPVTTATKNAAEAKELDINPTVETEPSEGNELTRKISS